MPILDDEDYRELRLALRGALRLVVDSIATDIAKGVVADPRSSEPGRQGDYEWLRSVAPSPGTVADAASEAARAVDLLEQARLDAEERVRAASEAASQAASRLAEEIEVYEQAKQEGSLRPGAGVDTSGIEQRVADLQEAVERQAAESRDLNAGINAQIAALAESLEKRLDAQDGGGGDDAFGRVTEQLSRLEQAASAPAAESNADITERLGRIEHALWNDLPGRVAAEASGSSDHLGRVEGSLSEIGSKLDAVVDCVDRVDAAVTNDLPARIDAGTSRALQGIEQLEVRTGETALRLDSQVGRLEYVVNQLSEALRELNAPRPAVNDVSERAAETAVDDAARATLVAEVATPEPEAPADAAPSLAWTPGGVVSATPALEDEAPAGDSAPVDAPEPPADEAAIAETRAPAAPLEPSTWAPWAQPPAEPTAAEPAVEPTDSATAGAPDAPVGEPDAPVGEPDAPVGEPDAPVGEPDIYAEPGAETPLVEEAQAGPEVVTVEASGSGIETIAEPAAAAGPSAVDEAPSADAQPEVMLGEGGRAVTLRVGELRSFQELMRVSAALSRLDVVASASVNSYRSLVATLSVYLAAPTAATDLSRQLEDALGSRLTITDASPTDLNLSVG